MNDNQGEQLIEKPDQRCCPSYAHLRVQNRLVNVLVVLATLSDNAAAMERVQWREKSRQTLHPLEKSKEVTVKGNIHAH